MTVTATATAARTAEQGHEPYCLAHAMICAIENARDVEGQTLVGFRQWAQGNEALTWAEGYLADGTATCLCPPIAEPEPTLVRCTDCDLTGGGRMVSVDGGWKCEDCDDFLAWADLTLEANERQVDVIDPDDAHRVLLAYVTVPDSDLATV